MFEIEWERIEMMRMDGSRLVQDIQGRGVLRIRGEKRGVDESGCKWGTRCAVV